MSYSENYDFSFSGIIAGLKINLTSTGVFSVEPNVPEEPEPVVSKVIVAGNKRQTMFLEKSTGFIWGTGRNTDFALSDKIPLSSRQSYPILIVDTSFKDLRAPLVDIIDLSNDHYVCLKEDGSVWTWGGHYELLANYGNSSITEQQSYPVSVAGGHSFKKVVAGNLLTAALKEDGSVWEWGYGPDSDGNPTMQPIPEPMLVPGNHSFVDIDLRGSHVLALKENGEVWSWGLNSIGDYTNPIKGGQLGDGTLQGKSSPVAVIGNHSFSKVFAGGKSSAALKEDGTLWTWGNNSSGQLGIGSNDDSLSPVQVTGHSFVNISMSTDHCLGLKSDGSMWAWGSDTYYLSSNVPIQVSSDSFIEVHAGYRTSFGIKENGEVWGFGLNLDGQLGIDNRINQSIPVQVAKIF